jgi:sirohydrochlorin ferrochelatase
VRRHGRGGAPGRIACLLIGHGSRVAAANQLLRRVARAVGRRLGGGIVEACFLEAATPDIQAGVDRCLRRGARRILFVPYFLYLGGHVRRDLPREARRARARHHGVTIAVAPHLGFDHRLVAIAAERARHGTRRAGWGGRWR